MPYHTIFLSNNVGDKTLLTPGNWIVGAHNALKTTLINFGSGRFWGTDPGFSGASISAPYEVSAMLSTDINDMCQNGCSNNGLCVNNVCKCTSNKYVHYSGKACEIEAQVIPKDVAINTKPLPLGEWAAFFVPIESVDIDKSFYAEIAFPESPDTLPFLFVSKASKGVPTANTFCGVYWGNGPYGSQHCEIQDFNADGEAIDNPLETVGLDYHYLILEPELNVLDDGTPEEGFYIAVYNHPGHGDAELEFKISARFIFDPSSSKFESHICPFECSMKGKCLPPFDPTNSIGRCKCDTGFAGPYCNDSVMQIEVEQRIEEELESGDWQYFMFSPKSSGKALVTMRKEMENIAKPFLFVKEEEPPTLASVYASQPSTYEIILDRNSNGISRDEYTDHFYGEGYPGNIYLDLSAIPAGKAISQ